jgi:hypothetical protein
MERENDGIRRAAALTMIALLLSIGLVGLFPVSATPELSNYHMLNIPMANGARFTNVSATEYYFKLTGGGLNAMHITNDPINDYDGSVHHGNATDTFWVSDTGGRGFNDDIVVLASVNGTPGANFSLKVNSSGYTWPLTYNAAVPTENTLVYSVGQNGTVGINGTFTASDFAEDDYGVDFAQIWKPCTSSNYPIYYGQNMGDTSKTFNLMFIDLKVGNIGTNSSSVPYSANLTDRGSARVDYTVTDLGNAKLAFNTYGWCNWSNQQQGVSWTNALTGTGASSWDYNF